MTGQELFDRWMAHKAFAMMRHGAPTDEDGAFTLGTIWPCLDPWERAAWEGIAAELSLRKT